ncbi:hypothetical protein ARMSODRAFT_1027065 [Armillaria solidipes]|uniref:Endonuclease/exonuclease/phosphatase domain-containing protein n=1 Tax=Armillaria solidipes TaxID=1076256 RepID=A0A2H3B1I8_9AGAR|nr:hypothetical protein ARMSODRAFT_1027065 [Armillaria solidipes]
MSTHITALRISTSDTEFILCNAYNIPESNKTIRELRSFFNAQDADTPTLLLGDFNKHHALWAGPHVPDRCAASDSEELIQLLAELGLELTLPPGTPTFTSAAHKTTSTLDLVFATHETLAPSVICQAIRPK